MKRILLNQNVLKSDQFLPLFIKSFMRIYELMRKSHEIKTTNYNNDVSKMHKNYNIMQLQVR